jgi:phage terminase Nu1 subunit (DNA packaging protein)
MTGQHFDELIGTVCMTKKVTQRDLAIILNVHFNTISMWKRNGVPAKMSSRIRSTLSAFMRGDIVLWQPIKTN